jgi:hypothetical protein
MEHCRFCNKEFELPSVGWDLCPDCFINNRPEREHYDEVMADHRARAHRDKKVLDNLAALPYTERMEEVKVRRGHILYPPLV